MYVQIHRASSLCFDYQGCGGKWLPGSSCSAMWGGWETAVHIMGTNAVSHSYLRLTELEPLISFFTIDSQSTQLVCCCFFTTTISHLKRACFGWNLTGLGTTGHRLAPSPLLCSWFFSQRRKEQLCPWKGQCGHSASLVSRAFWNWPPAVAGSEDWASLLNNTSGTLTPTAEKMAAHSTR